MIKYIGKKHLNSNFYKQISLKKENDYIKVRAIVDERFKNVPKIKIDTQMITEQIECLDDYEKIKEIVLYFLRNNTIYEITQNKDEIIISSTSSRKLVLNLTNEYKELLGLIINKYQNDRLSFIEKCNEENIHIRTVYFDERIKIRANTTGYFIGIDKINEDSALVLSLLSKNHEIVSFDKEFIINYIKELINKCEREIIYIKDELEGKLFVNGKIIRIPEELLREVYFLVFNRNKEIYDINNNQLKLVIRKGEINYGNGKIG